jgi:hypothetical protein
VIRSLHCEQVTQFYSGQFQRKFNKNDGENVELVKRLLWPLMGDNPRREAEPAASKAPARPSWFDATDDLGLGHVFPAHQQP